MDHFIVLKQQPGGAGPVRYGPIKAANGMDAIISLCRGETSYVAPGHGRFHAIPLAVWQGGTYDWTKARGAEQVFPHQVGPYHLGV